MASQHPKAAAAEPARKALDTPPTSADAHLPADKPAPPAGSLQNLTTPDASSAPQLLEVPAIAADSGSNSGLASAPEAVPVTDLQKKLKRAERFGTPVMLSEEEKRNSRAERFGTGLPTMSGNKNVEQEEQKRKARAERFGLNTNSVADEEAKKKARLERFAPNSKIDSTEEEKRKARAIRFSQGSPKVSGQANSDLKATTVANT